jgi:hypothetical protein
MYDRQAYTGYEVVTLRNAHARPRSLSLGKANKPRTRKAKKQYVPGYPPRHLTAYSWR